MTRFYFVRHGETDENKAHKIQGRRDIPLNDTGRAQAKKSGEFIKNMNITFDKVYSSPLSRAYETACIICQNIDGGHEVIKKESFTERCFGVKEGCDVSREVFVDINNDSAEGLEKSYEIQKRVMDEVLSITKNEEYENVLVVAHSHTIKALTTAIDPINYRFDSKLANCALTIFESNEGKVSIIDYNIETQ